MGISPADANMRGSYIIVFCILSVGHPRCLESLLLAQRWGRSSPLRLAQEPFIMHWLIRS